MNIKLFTIPNFLTLGNLFCGCLACVLILYGIQIHIILILICASLLFDLLDGMVARALNINSEIGIQLDSLADMISFGLLPGLLMFKLMCSGDFILDVEYFSHTIFNTPKPVNIPYHNSYLSLFAFMIPLFSALRLAKFNIDKEQTIYFKGLPTPANTILIFSLFSYFSDSFLNINRDATMVPYFISVPICIICSLLLISDIPLFSFKFKGFAWKDNHYKYVFLIISIILLILFQMNSVPFIILLYIIISIIFRKKIIHA